jgi:hypothetical protein
MKAQVVSFGSRIDVIQDEMRARVSVMQYKMDAWLKETTACQKATEASLEKMEAYLERKEPTPVETASVAAHPEGS